VKSSFNIIIEAMAMWSLNSGLFSNAHTRGCEEAIEAFAEFSLISRSERPHLLRGHGPMALHVQNIKDDDVDAFRIFLGMLPSVNTAQREAILQSLQKIRFNDGAN